MILELFVNRKNDFDAVEQKMRALIYKTFLTMPV